MLHPATSKNKKMRCISRPLMSLLRAVPAMSVELFDIVSADQTKRKPVETFSSAPHA
jgi:hypothetical protein